MPDFAVKTAFTAVDRVSPAFNRMGGAADRFGKKTTSVFAQVASAAGMFGGIALLAMGLKKVATSAMMIEDAQASFTPLLGSVEKAGDLVERLNILGAETPFQFEDLAKTAKQLLPVMNGDLNNTIATMRMLGDTAGGNADKLESITRGYTKAMLKGKVDMESLNMIAEAGVPIHTELAKSMGYGKDRMAEFFKRVSAGKVSTDDLNKAFVKMTSAGGIFYQGMIIASKTTSGVLSTLFDNLTMVAAAIGEELLPTFKNMAIGISEAASSVLNFIKKNKGLISGVVNVLIFALPKLLGLFLAWKIYTWAVFIAQKALIGIGWIKYLNMMWPVILKSVGATNAWELAQWGINTALSANPIGLVIISIAALSYAVYELYSNWDKYQTGINLRLAEMSNHWDYAKYRAYQFLNMLGLVSDESLKLAKIDFMKSFDAFTVAKGLYNKAFGPDEKKEQKAPNQSEVDMKNIMDYVVNINNSANVNSEVKTNNKQAKVNMNKLGYQQ